MSLPRPLSTLVAIAAVITALSSQTFANTIVDTGTGDGSFRNGLGVNRARLATEFTITDAATVSSVEGWLGYLQGGFIDIRIHADNGTTPGAVLFAGSFATPTFTPNLSWQGIYGLHWSLAAGTYWISFGTPTVGWGVLGGHTPSPLGLEAYSDTDPSVTGLGAWHGFNNGADYGVRILGSSSSSGSVPDGGCTALLLGGALAAGFLFRRRTVS